MMAETATAAITSPRTIALGSKIQNLNASLGLFKAIDLADQGVIQRCEDLGLALEAG